MRHHDLSVLFAVQNRRLRGSERRMDSPVARCAGRFSMIPCLVRINVFAKPAGGNSGGWGFVPESGIAIRRETDQRRESV